MATAATSLLNLTPGVRFRHQNPGRWRQRAQEQQAALAASSIPPDSVVTSEYQPIPVLPAGGLLATAVGTPQTPLPPAPPAQQAVEMPATAAPATAPPGGMTGWEDDDVFKQMEYGLSQDNDYMKLAKTSGLQTAHRRGLLNTSLAAGHSQAAAISAVAPLATQNAQQRAQRNLERLSSHYAGERQQIDIRSRNEMLDKQLKSEETRLGRQLASNEMLAAKDIAARMTMQQRQLTANEKLAVMDIQARMQMQGRDLAAQEKMQSSQISAQFAMADKNIQAESIRLGRQLTAQEMGQQRDIAAAQTRLDTELAMRAGMDREGRAATIALEAMRDANDDDRAALSYSLQQDQLYAQQVQSIMANKDLPAPTRDRMLAEARALRDISVSTPNVILGGTTSWSNGSGSGGTSSSPTGTRVTDIRVLANLGSPASGMEWYTRPTGGYGQRPIGSA